MIGAGKMANRVHYPSLASFHDAEMIAISDLVPERMNQTADRYHIERRFKNYREMIEQTGPDAVYAVGPPHHMYDVWVWCLERGLNLFIEKPMGITLHQARILAYLAEKHGCITQVGFQRRASPLANSLWRECLERGAIVHAVCRFYKNEISPFTSALGHVMDDSVHAIDTLRWLCGGEVTSIHTFSKSVQVPDTNFVTATIQFDTGATGVLLNSWSSGRRIFAVEMHAPGICAEADLEGEGRLFRDGDTAGLRHDARTVAGSDELFVFGGFQAKNREFINAVRNRAQPGSHFSDALKTMEIAERVLAQIVCA
jgi:predicted dehydrogenase